MIEERKYYVYIWFIKDTGEVFYVGKGCGQRYKTISRRNKFFLDMYHSHDCDVKIIYDALTEEEAYSKEYETIRWYRENTNYRLTNQTDGGDGTRGYKMKPEQKSRMSQAIKARWADPYYKARIIEGRHQPDSTYQSEAFRQKISSLVRGKNNPNYGHYWTAEMKKALSDKRIGVYANENNPKAKPIRCVETGEEFSCIKYAKEKYGVKWDASFTAAIDKPTRTAAGLHWVTIPKDQYQPTL